MKPRTFAAVSAGVTNASGFALGGAKRPTFNTSMSRAPMAASPGANNRSAEDEHAEGGEQETPTRH